MFSFCSWPRYSLQFVINIRNLLFAVRILDMRIRNICALGNLHKWFAKQGGVGVVRGVASGVAWNGESHSAGHATHAELESNSEELYFGPASSNSSSSSASTASFLGSASFD